MGISIKKTHLIYIILLILFLTGFFIRVGIDGMPLSHPGNMKAANAFYHTVAADHIADSGKIFTNPSWDVEGNENLLNVVSQHQAVMIAPLIKLTGIPDWVSAYYIICFLSALAIPCMYLLTKKVFKSSLIGLVSAAILVIPLDVSRWLYFMYIGIWLQSSVTPFLLLSIVLSIDTIKNPNLWRIFSLGILIAAMFLMFPPSIFFVLPLLLVIMYKLTIKLKLKKLAAYTIPSIISMIIFIPILLVGDLKSATERTTIEWATPNVSNPLFAQTHDAIPIVLLIFAILGLIQIILNYKKYTKIILFLIFTLITFYLLPYLIHGHLESYLMRMRGFYIYLVAPLAAYGIYFIIIKNTSKFVKKFKNKKLIITAIICLIIILAGIPQYSSLTKQTKYEHISKEKYEAMEWIQENVPKEEYLLALEGDYQIVGTYFERTRFMLETDQLATYLQGLSEGKDPNIIEGGWGGYARYSDWKYRTGYFSFEKYEPLPTTMKITNFNYIYLEGLSQELQQFNLKVTSWLTTEEGYTIAYQKNQYIVLERKNE